MAKSGSVATCANLQLEYPYNARLLRVAFAVETFAEVVFLPEISKDLAE